MWIEEEETGRYVCCAGLREDNSELSLKLHRQSLNALAGRNSYLSRNCVLITAGCCFRDIDRDRATEGI